jgi:hypothetical protein
VELSAYPPTLCTSFYEGRGCLRSRTYRHNNNFCGVFELGVRPTIRKRKGKEEKCKRVTSEGSLPIYWSSWSWPIKKSSSFLTYALSTSTSPSECFAEAAFQGLDEFPTVWRDFCPKLRKMWNEENLWNFFTFVLDVLIFCCVINIMPIQYARLFRLEFSFAIVCWRVHLYWHYLCTNLIIQ